MRKHVSRDVSKHSIGHVLGGVGYVICIAQWPTWVCSGCTCVKKATNLQACIGSKTTSETLHRVCSAGRSH